MKCCCWVLKAILDMFPDLELDESLCCLFWDIREPLFLNPAPFCDNSLITDIFNMLMEIWFLVISLFYPWEWISCGSQNITHSMLLVNEIGHETMTILRSTENITYVICKKSHRKDKLGDHMRGTHRRMVVDFVLLKIEVLGYSEVTHLITDWHPYAHVKFQL